MHDAQDVLTGLADGSHTLKVKGDRPGRQPRARRTATPGIWTPPHRAGHDHQQRPDRHRRRADSRGVLTYSNPRGRREPRVPSSTVWRSRRAPARRTLVGPRAEGDHTFSVRATDGAGTTTPRPPPAPARSTPRARHDPHGGPIGSDHRAPRATFGFSREAGVTYQCRLEPAAWCLLLAAGVHGGSADGPHTFRVRLVTAIGTSTRRPPPAPSRSTPPHLTRRSRRARPARSRPTTAGFPLLPQRGRRPPFQCKPRPRATGPPARPSTPSTNLTAGAHTFNVRATDTAGNTDQTPATRTFTVDTVAPETTIDRRAEPARPTTAPPHVRVHLQRGRLDASSAASTSATSRPYVTARRRCTLGRSRDGTYTFVVARHRRGRATVDADAAPRATFTVDTVGSRTPSITTGPAGRDQQRGRRRSRSPRPSPARASSAAWTAAPGAPAPRRSRTPASPTALTPSRFERRTLPAIPTRAPPAAASASTPTLLRPTSIRDRWD